MNIFYTPEGAAFGDCMPFFADGTYYLYHQRDPQFDAPLSQPLGWALVTTKDFVTFEDKGEVIAGAGNDAADQYIFAGSVYRKPGGRFEANYTGFNSLRAGTDVPSQVLMRATSDDLVIWEKEGRFELPPQQGYDPDDWRDPFVFWNDDLQQWMLILGTRGSGPKVQRKGRTVWFSSPDAETWQFEGDLYAPGLYTGHEMPDEFTIGGRWYLLTTEYSACSKTVYAMGKSALGPWIRTNDDAFDGRAYYAARSASDGCRRFLFGWVANKKDRDDRATFVWGGTLVVHEIQQRADGTLGAVPPHEVFEAVMANAGREVAASVRAENRREVEEIATTGSASYGVDATVTVSPGTRSFSMLFAGDSELDQWYAFTVDLAQHRLSFDRSPNWPWNQFDNKGLERPLPENVGDTEIRLRLIVDGTVAVVYLNDIALSTRVNNPAGSSLGFDVENGAITVSARVSNVAEALIDVER